MKNVALAFHNYADVHKAFPLGGDAPCINTWCLQTLPFIEQSALYAAYDFRYNFGSGTNATLLKPTRIAAYSCPSNGDKKSTYPSAGSYRHHNVVVCLGNAGFYKADGTETNRGKGWAPYGDITIDNGAPFWVGSETYGYKWITLGAFTDGLSNTMVISETIQGERAPTAHGAGPIDLRGLIWWTPGTGFTAYNAPNTKLPDIMEGAFVKPAYPGGGTFYPDRHPLAVMGSDSVCVLSARSFHSGGVNAGIGDGSVSFRSDTVNIDAWRASATIRGGESVSP
jgi:hypothetical protein